MSKGIIFGLIILVVLAVGAAAYFFMGKKAAPTDGLDEQPNETGNAPAQGTRTGATPDTGKAPATGITPPTYTTAQITQAKKLARVPAVNLTGLSIDIFNSGYIKQAWEDRKAALDALGLSSGTLSPETDGAFMNIVAQYIASEIQKGNISYNAGSSGRAGATQNAQFFYQAFANQYKLAGKNLPPYQAAAV